MRRKFSIARLLAFTLLTVLLVLGGVEWAARALYPEQKLVINPINEIFRDDPTLFWVLKPDLHTTFRRNNTLNTNSLGLRNAEIEVPKPPNVYRILSLGESSTFGDGVDDNETYAKVLETLLNDAAKSRTDGRRYEVINAGVGAYTIWQSFIYLSARGLKLEPDMVMIYHQHNDFLPTGVIDQNNFLYQVELTDRQLYMRRRKVAPLLRLLYHSRMYQVLRYRMLMQPSSLPKIHTKAAEFGERVPKQDRVYALEGIHRICDEHHMGMLVILPTYSPIYNHDFLLPRFAAKYQLPYVDLPKLRTEAALSDDDFFLDGIHPKPYGHRFIAEAILKELQKQGL